MEKFTASRLIGSPPGYVGYEEGGQLSEAVRRRPYSVVLFDEIEKAHPDVMNLLLQILEEGKITDSLGRKIDFRNTIIIMTSNVGAELIKRQMSLGFGTPKDDQDYETMKGKILEESKRVFKPEFLNRLDDLIVFHTLTKTDLLRIVDLEVSKVVSRIKNKDIHVTLNEAAKEFLIEKGYDPTYGARPDAPGGREVPGRPVRGRTPARQREGRRHAGHHAGRHEARIPCDFRQGRSQQRAGHDGLSRSG